MDEVVGGLNRGGTTGEEGMRGMGPDRWAMYVEEELKRCAAEPPGLYEVRISCFGWRASHESNQGKGWGV